MRRRSGLSDVGEHALRLVNEATRPLIVLTPTAAAIVGSSGKTTSRDLLQP